MADQNHFDVIIIGGGPAGSSCARLLTKAGLGVAILDKAEFPRDKVCAGWITPAVLETLDIEASDYAKGLILQPITSFRSSCEFRSPVETRYHSVVSYGIRRFEFDDYLLARCGAEILSPQPVKKIETRSGGWLINGTYSTPLLIGAGGHGCPVSRHLGNQLGNKITSVAAQEIETEMTVSQSELCRIQPEQPELVFSNKLNGYGWVFRKNNWLNIGFGCEERGNIRTQVGSFYEALKRSEKIPPDLNANFKGHSYLLYRHAQRKILDDGVLLIGDAAGLAYSQSGEGIKPAIESGLLAAETIIEAQADYRSTQLMPYADKLIRRFGKRNSAPGEPNSDGKLRHLVGKTLLANRWLTRHLVLDRWFLHRQKPALKPALK